jgi:plasmid stabilization system protein ParE
MTVLVLEDAAADLEAGRRFYESREPGVGEYFVESLLSDLESLVHYAGIHRRHFGLHRMLSKRFPFGIYYEIEGDTACVYAILDMRRDPIWLRAELGKRT